MACQQIKPIYVPHTNGGILTANPQNDGYGIAIDWCQAFPVVHNDKIAYNIYYSTLMNEVFNEGVKFVSTSTTEFAAIIAGLTPGDFYYFGVRATEYNPAWYDLDYLPNVEGLKMYPEGLLLADVSDTDMTIKTSDVDQFPPYGIVQIGSELIYYGARDFANSTLIVGLRGYLSTEARSHTTDGYDGYRLTDGLVRFWKGNEEDNIVVAQAGAIFKYPNYAFTNHDGYKQTSKSDLITDLSASDANMADFKRYDYSGWHRTNPGALLRGECIGTYYGGEQFCADGYGVGFQVRGVPFNEENARRQEMLLEAVGTGEPCVLLSRLWTGTVCNCYEPNHEQPKLRCPVCYSTGFVSGYQQTFNERRSDRRILVRFGTTEEDLKQDEDGMESVLIPDCWTLVYPTLRDRDVLIRFNEDGTEEFRYEILSVSRNKLLNSLSGGQKFKAQRLRRTSPVYTWRAVYDVSTMPTKINTSIGYLAGPNGVNIPHTHTLVINENTLSVNQINQTTSVVQFHEHPVISGVVQPVLGHVHNLILV